MSEYDVPEDFDDPLMYLLHIGNEIHRLNKKSEGLGLSLVQWCLLRRLIDMPAVSPQVLAKAIGVHPSTLTQTLRRMERKKYVYVTEDSHDSRRKIISITRVGCEILESASAHMRKWSSSLREETHSMKKIQSRLSEQIEAPIDL